MVLEAIHGVLEDPTFKLPSAPAAAAQNTVSLLIDHCGEPSSALEHIKLNSLVSQLKACFLAKRGGKPKRKVLGTHII